MSANHPVHETKQEQRQGAGDALDMNGKFQSQAANRLLQAGQGSVPQCSPNERNQKGEDRDG